MFFGDVGGFFVQTDGFFGMVLLQCRDGALLVKLAKLFVMTAFAEINFFDVKRIAIVGQIFQNRIVCLNSRFAFALIPQNIGCGAAQIGFDPRIVAFGAADLRQFVDIPADAANVDILKQKQRIVRAFRQKLAQRHACAFGIAHSRNVYFDDFAQTELLRRLPIDAALFDKTCEFFPIPVRTVYRHERILNFFAVFADFPQMFPIGYRQSRLRKLAFGDFRRFARVKNALFAVPCHVDDAPIHVADRFVIVRFAVFVLHIRKRAFVGRRFAQQLLIRRFCFFGVVQFVEINPCQLFQNAASDFGQIGPNGIEQHIFHQLDEIVPILRPKQTARFLAISRIVAQTLFLAQFGRNGFDFKRRTVVGGRLRRRSAVFVFLFVFFCAAGVGGCICRAFGDFGHDQFGRSVFDIIVFIRIFFGTNIGIRIFFGCGVDRFAGILFVLRGRCNAALTRNVFIAALTRNIFIRRNVCGDIGVCRCRDFLRCAGFAAVRRRVLRLCDIRIQNPGIVRSVGRFRQLSILCIIGRGFAEKIRIAAGNLGTALRRAAVCRI